MFEVKARHRASAFAAGNGNRHSPGREAHPRRVKRQMEKSQREYYLNEQVKAIQRRLGEGEDGADLEEMEKPRQGRGAMPKEARKKAEGELKKLRLMSPMSAEATVVRNYVETLVNLPWKKRSKISRDIGAAEKILDADHYGLEKVKERIVEYLAVQIRVDKVKAPILCLVGGARSGKNLSGNSRSLAPPTANSCACRWAACATRPDPRSPTHLYRLDAR